jgi:parvulin-like peptidyl-prolyl isomerase
MTEKKPLKVVFDPGCFDNFEGTQEELDEFVAQIQAMAESGLLFENSVEMTDEDLEELDEETRQQLIKALNRDPRSIN